MHSCTLHTYMYVQCIGPTGKRAYINTHLSTYTHMGMYESTCILCTKCMSAISLLNNALNSLLGQ